MAVYQRSVDYVITNINKEDIDGIFLPYIQRDFVWKENDIYKLLDSMMRRYPIGTILAWDTQEQLNYRPFIQDYTSNFDVDKTIIIPNEENLPRKRYYVLDGQQRLQSLYIALRGKYEGNELYFNLASNPKSDDGYMFKFMPDKEATSNWMKIKDLVILPPSVNLSERLHMSGAIKTPYTDELKKRIETNATRCYDVFRNALNIPMETLTDSNEINLSDIAEIFARTNSEGTVLEKSDLFMASIKGVWVEAGAEFNKIHKSLQSIGFKNTKDFVMRAFLAMLGEGTKYDEKKLAKSEIQLKMKAKFKDFSAAIFDVLRFVADLHFIGSKNVPSWSPLLLLTCYRYHYPDAWEKDKHDAVSNFLFMAFLSKAFSTQSAPMLDSLIKHVRQYGFDLSEIEKICHKYKKDLTVSIDDILDMHIEDKAIDLVLHLLYMGKSQYKRHDILHKDHIFPDSILRSVKDGKKQKYLKKIRDQLANIEWLPLNDNLDKSDMLPRLWFEKFDMNYWDFHMIPKDASLLELDNFEKFIEQRKALISIEITGKLPGLIITSTPKKAVKSKKTIPSSESE